MSSDPIPCLALGKDRRLAETVAARLRPHNFVVNAAIDGSLFSAENLKTVILALLPRPKVLVIGGGYSDEEASVARQMWDEYTTKYGVDNAVVVRVVPGILQSSGRDGLADWILGELKKSFH